MEVEQPASHPVRPAIKNDRGVEAHGTNTYSRDRAAAARPARDGRVRPGDGAHGGELLPSVSFVELVGEDIEPLDRRYDVLEFRVTAVDRSFGIANLRSQITVRPQTGGAN